MIQIMFCKLLYYKISITIIFILEKFHYIFFIIQNQIIAMSVSVLKTTNNFSFSRCEGLIIKLDWLNEISLLYLLFTGYNKACQI